MTIKSKRMHIVLPEHLKSKIEQTSNYYGITQSEIVKDSVKVALRDFDKLRNKK